MRSTLDRVTVHPEIWAAMEPFCSRGFHTSNEIRHFHETCLKHHRGWKPLKNIVNMNSVGELLGIKRKVEIQHHEHDSFFWIQFLDGSRNRYKIDKRSIYSEEQIVAHALLSEELCSGEVE